MRKQLVKTIEEKLANDNNLVLLLGDIGVFGFRNSFSKYPERVLNIGILEPATVGLAAGLAKSNLIPVVHTIAPFLVERAFEQIKIDFGYQNIGGNLISVGASYDYASLGCTHHCPADVGLLFNIPNIEIIVPGTSYEFDNLFSSAYANGNCTYFRLSEKENNSDQSVEFGKANLIKSGDCATVMAIGPTLDLAIEATKNLDVTLLYYTTLQPFDGELLRNHMTSTGKIFIIEPFYVGTMLKPVINVLKNMPLLISGVGVPNEFLRSYGKREDHDIEIGMTVQNIYDKLVEMVHEY